MAGMARMVRMDRVCTKYGIGQGPEMVRTARNGQGTLAKGRMDTRNSTLYTVYILLYGVFTNEVVVRCPSSVVRCPLSVVRLVSHQSSSLDFVPRYYLVTSPYLANSQLANSTPRLPQFRLLTMTHAHAKKEKKTERKKKEHSWIYYFFSPPQAVVVGTLAPRSRVLPSIESWISWIAFSPTTVSMYLLYTPSQTYISTA